MANRRIITKPLYFLYKMAYEIHTIILLHTYFLNTSIIYNLKKHKNKRKYAKIQNLKSDISVITVLNVIHKCEIGAPSSHLYSDVTATFNIPTHE